jgi:hypothetical protein
MVAASMTIITAVERAEPNGQLRADRNWLTM